MQAATLTSYTLWWPPSIRGDITAVSWGCTFTTLSVCFCVCVSVCESDRFLNTARLTEKEERVCGRLRQSGFIWQMLPSQTYQMAWCWEGWLTSEEQPGNGAATSDISGGFSSCQCQLCCWLEGLCVAERCKTEWLVQEMFLSGRYFHDASYDVPRCKNQTEIQVWVWEGGRMKSQIQELKGVTVEVQIPCVNHPK